MNNVVRSSYPDIGILKPRRIAIELDYPKERNPGSPFKAALAKGAFVYLSGGWDYCIILFHNDSGKGVKPYLNREKKRRDFKSVRKNSAQK